MAASEDVQSRSGIAAHWVLALTSAFVDAASWYLFIPVILLIGSYSSEPLSFDQTK